MKNELVVKILNNIAGILELQEVKFKPHAYRRAALSIESLTEQIEDIYERNELEEIPGVGIHIAKKIVEIIETGKLKYYEKLRKEIKVDIEQLSAIPFLGPKKIRILYKKLKIKNIKDLEKAIKKGKLRKLEGFGEKTEETILQGIKFLKNKPKRFTYIHALPIIAQIKNELNVPRFEVAGSFRRGKETIGDLDLLVVSKNPKNVMKTFISMKDVKTVLAKGPTKSSVRLLNNLQVDLRVVKEKEFGAALLYFTGSKQHNVELRKLALKKGVTLNEYNLSNIKTQKYIAGKTEEQIYGKLGLNYIPPELRENRGELNSKLPKLITNKDIKGVFHNHTKWSDGNNTILEMAKKAEELKFKFISLTDHFGPLGIANALNEKRLNKYLEAINKAQKKVGIKIYNGIEIEILKDGSLPLSNKKLKELDVVIASVHMANKMKIKEMTKRVTHTLENYPINILGHPTDRLLNKREPLQINLDKVFKSAKDNDIFLEINAAPKRMDLSGENIKAALDIGSKFALSTDAHNKDHLPYYFLGVNMARRGWIEKKNLLNCWSLNKIEKHLSI